MTEMTPADYAAINRGGGMGFGGDGAWWLIVLFLFAMNGGWGNGWGNAGGGGADAYMQRGFDQSAVMNGINGIQSAVNGIGNQLCNSFAQAEIAANSRQMADMNQMFGVQTALQNCCCENRANIADLKYTVATENCADRAAVSDGIRDLLAATQAQTQTILHGIKSGETIAAMKGGDGYSRRDGSYYDGGSYARKRNSMGRYSRGDGQDGYSRHDTPSLKRKLMELMEESPEEYRDLMSQLDG